MLSFRSSRAVIGALALLTAAAVAFFAATARGVSPAAAVAVSEPAAVKAVGPDIVEHFAIFREAPAASMPKDVAEALASPARFGRNAALAREISTPAGPGWVVPGDGFVCLIAPDHLDSYGTSCNKTEAVLRYGISVALRDGVDGPGYITALIPDGAEAELSSGSLPLRSDLGVVTAAGRSIVPAPFSRWLIRTAASTSSRCTRSNNSSACSMNCVRG